MIWKQNNMLPELAVPTALKKQQNNKDRALLNVPVRLIWPEKEAYSILEYGQKNRCKDSCFTGKADHA